VGIVSCRAILLSIEPSFKFEFAKEVCMLKLIPLTAFLSFSSIFWVVQTVQSQALPIEYDSFETSQSPNHNFFCFMEMSNSVILDLSVICERTEEEQAQNDFTSSEVTQASDISDLSQLEGTSFRERLEVFCNVATPQEMGTSLRGMCERLF
jgi:hypothetical protein